MKIKSIKIKGLWGLKDIEWNFVERINFLTGKNGTGKSSILDALYLMLYSGYADETNFASTIEVALENGVILKANAPFPKKDFRYSNFSVQGMPSDIEIEDYIKENIHLVPISTFDTPLYSPRDMQILDKMKDDKRIRTELDYEIFMALAELYQQLSQQYSSIQNAIRLAKSAVQIRQSISTVMERTNKLILFLNDMFADSQKTINMNTGTLEIRDSLGRTLTPYQLSSGEKQLFYIALTVFLANDKKSLILMDEPELSLHTEWQRKLMNRLIDISPDCQFIIATHAPSFIPNGFNGCTMDIQDITK